MQLGTILFRQQADKLNALYCYGTNQWMSFTKKYLRAGVYQLEKQITLKGHKPC